MFGLLKKKFKQESELEFFKKFCQTDYPNFAKILFPIRVYTKLPSHPRNLSWPNLRTYILDNLISSSFADEFERSYQKTNPDRFEIIENAEKGDINLTKRDTLVHHFLESQPSIFLSNLEFKDSEHKLGDLNVFPQFLDYTPQYILEEVLKTIHAVFPNSRLSWQRHSYECKDWNLSEVLNALDDLEPFSFLDRMYDKNGTWELLQPEESPFLLIGTSSKELIHELSRKLEIENMGSS